MNLEALAKLAAEATPGPWHAGDNAGWWIACTPELEISVRSDTPPTPELPGGGERRDDFGVADERNAYYIAAADPTTVLALIRVAQAADAFDDIDFGDADPALRAHLRDALADLE